MAFGSQRWHGHGEVDLKELAASRSVFPASEGGQTWAICALHVDDGLLNWGLHKEKNGFTDRMDKHVQGIEPPDAPKGKPDTPLSPERDKSEETGYEDALASSAHYAAGFVPGV